MEAEVNLGRKTCQCVVTVVLQSKLWINDTNSMAIHLVTSLVLTHMLPTNLLCLENHTCLSHKLNVNNCLLYCLPILLWMSHLHLKLLHLHHLNLRLLHPFLIRLLQLLLSSYQVYSILFSQISFLDIQCFIYLFIFSSLHIDLSCLKMNRSLTQEPLTTWCTPYLVSHPLLPQLTVIFIYLMVKEC